MRAHAREIRRQRHRSDAQQEPARPRRAAVRNDIQHPYAARPIAEREQVDEPVDRIVSIGAFELTRFIKFILTEILPGGCLPSVQKVESHAGTYGFTVDRVHSVRPHLTAPRPSTYRRHDDAGSAPKRSRCNPRRSARGRSHTSPAVRSCSATAITTSISSRRARTAYSNQHRHDDFVGNPVTTANWANLPDSHEPQRGSLSRGANFSA